MAKSKLEIDTSACAGALRLLSRAAAEPGALPADLRSEVDAFMADSDRKGGFDAWFHLARENTALTPSPRLAALMANLRSRVRRLGA